MPIHGREKRKVFATCPRGQFQAVIADISFHPNEQKEFKGRHYTQDEYWIVYQMKQRIPDDFEDEEVRGKRFEIKEKYSDKMGVVPGRKVPKLVEHIADGLIGRRWTDVERYGDQDDSGRYDFERLIGSNCTIMVAHRTFEGGGVWAYVSAIVPFAGDKDNLLKPEPTIASMFEGNGDGQRNGGTSQPPPVDDEDFQG